MSSGVLYSIQSLETQISDLESESERLSRTLEQQRTDSVQSVTALNKRVEEFSRELQKKVTHVSITYKPPKLNCFSLKVSEIDQLRQKLKHFYDYDEIKRELQIMKASFS